MTLQDVVWTIALAGMGLVALIFIYIILQAGTTADEAAAKRAAGTAGTIRRWLFAALAIVFVAGTWATLHRYPIPRQHTTLDAKQVVDVVGRMWSWQLTPATVETGSTVEFRVTSGDVNHGFAIYAPDGHILTQAQAMPGYTNKLLYTFDQPGTYTVQCLEYCGLGHAPMTATFQVVAPKAE